MLWSKTKSSLIQEGNSSRDIEVLGNYVFWLWSMHSYEGPSKVPEEAGEKFPGLVIKVSQTSIAFVSMEASVIYCQKFLETGSIMCNLFRKKR